LGGAGVSGGGVISPAPVRSCHPFASLLSGLEGYAPPHSWTGHTPRCGIFRLASYAIIP